MESPFREMDILVRNWSGFCPSGSYRICRGIWDDDGKDGVIRRGFSDSGCYTVAWKRVYVSGSSIP